MNKIWLMLSETPSSLATKSSYHYYKSSLIMFAETSATATQRKKKKENSQTNFLSHLFWIVLLKWMLYGRFSEFMSSSWNWNMFFTALVRTTIEIYVNKTHNKWNFESVGFAVDWGQFYLVNCSGKESSQGHLILFGHRLNQYNGYSTFNGNPSSAKKTNFELILRLVFGESKRCVSTYELNTLI